MDTATQDAIARARGTTGTCWLCDAAVQRVPARDEWAWANEAGTCGLTGDLELVAAELALWGVEPRKGYAETYPGPDGGKGGPEGTAGPPAPGPPAPPPDA